MDRKGLSAHLPSVPGRVMPAWARRFRKLLQRRECLSRATTPLERKIRRAETGTLLTSSIPPITTNSASPIRWAAGILRSEEHTSELQSHLNLVCRLLLEKKKKAYVLLSQYCNCSANSAS